MRFLAAGESALVVELGDAIDPELNARVLALDRALLQTPFDGYLEAVPSYRSLLVFFDPEKAAKQAVEIATARRVTAHDGAVVPLEAETLCLHGDNKAALENARAVRKALEEKGLEIKGLSV